MNQPLILIVEDDKAVRNLIAATLDTQDYRYLTAGTGEQGLQEATLRQPDIVLLDLGLPDGDGVSIIRRIRTWSLMPIIVISARSEDRDKIEALDAGADDYLTKPFSMEILVARIQALLRRAYSYEPSGTLMEFQGAVFNLADASLSKDGRQCELTNNEFKILQLLLENKNKVVSREKIMLKLWNNDCFVDENTLTVNVNRLRRKMEQLGIDDCIETRKGLGYQLHA